MHICLLRGSKNVKNVRTTNKICSNSNLTSNFYTHPYVIVPNLKRKAKKSILNSVDMHASEKADIVSLGERWTLK